VSDTLGIAIIGVGRIGRMHADLISRRVEGATLIAVADAVGETAMTVADQLRVPARPVADVLSDPDVGAVAICSPSDTHVDFIVAAAAAGKAIFCEKPISLNLAEVDRSLAAVAAVGIPLMIGFNRRFDPAHASVAHAVASGEIGEPHLVRISSRDPAPPPLDYAAKSGGIFLDMTIHDFDMARFVSASEVTEVYADGALRIEPDLAAFGDVDTAIVHLRHENGCLTLIDNSRQAVYGYDQRVEVFGSKGMAASANPSAHTGVVYTADGTRSSTMPYFFLERYVPSYIHQWQRFVDAVRAGTPTPTSGADGRAPLVIGLAAMRSLREHRPVTTAEIEYEA
jgi:myo-inositol 2-dehydrogenase/D-chiro-inositol 1-dehydrogenase